MMTLEMIKEKEKQGFLSESMRMWAWLWVIFTLIVTGIHAQETVLVNRLKNLVNQEIKPETLHEFIEISRQVKQEKEKFLGNAAYSDVRQCYRDIQARLGEYYFRSMQYKNALACYREAQQYNSGSANYQQNIDDCLEANGKIIIYVVDVSQGMNLHKKAINNLISQTYDDLQNMGYHEFHLVIFSDFPLVYSYLPKESGAKDKILSALSDGFQAKAGFNRNIVYPQYALGVVNEITGTDFPGKVPVVLFISQGKNSLTGKRSKQPGNNSLEKTVAVLKRNGYNIFCIYFQNENGNGKEFMNSIASTAKTALIQIKKGHVDQDINDAVNRIRQMIDGLILDTPVLRSWLEDEKKKWIDDYNRLDKENHSLLQEKLESSYRVSTMMYHFGIQGILSIQTRIANRRLKLENKNRRQLHPGNKSFWDYLFRYLSVALAIWIGFLYWQKKQKRLPFKKEPLSLLWGRIEYKINKNKQEPVYLGKQKSGYCLEPPNGLPKLDFTCGFRDGKKVIEIQKEKGTVKYLYYPGVPCNDYIDFDTRGFEVAYDGKKQLFEYHFLDILENLKKEPIWEMDDFFKGRTKQIEQIILGLIDRKDHHFLIHGTGNIGKTTLMNRLHKKIFKDDNRVNQTYDSIYIEYKADIHKTYSHFKTDLDKCMETFQSDKPRKIVMIDNYDQGLEELKVDFFNLLKHFFNTDGYYLILSGQKNDVFLHPDWRDLISRKTTLIPLKGLDDSVGIISTCHQSVSVELLYKYLDHIGFPSDYLSVEVAQKMAQLASGFPGLIQRILKELLTIWLKSDKMHPLKVSHVEDVIKPIINSTRDYLLERAHRLDINGRINIPDTEVRVSEIFNAIARLSDSRGKVESNKLTKQLAESSAYAKKIREERRQSLTLKMEKLFHMGFAEKEGDCIVGIPNIFFYRKENLYDN